MTRRLRTGAAAVLVAALVTGMSAGSAGASLAAGIGPALGLRHAPHARYSPQAVQAGSSSTGAVLGRVLLAGRPDLGPATGKVCVVAAPAAGMAGAVAPVTARVTEATGQFELGRLEPGAWRIGFRSCNRTFSFESFVYGGGTVVAVLPGRVAPIRTVVVHPILELGRRRGLAKLAALMAGPDRPAGSLRIPASSSQGSISGAVTNARHKPLKGICVVAFGFTTGVGRAVAVIGANGTYRLTKLAAGRYAIGFGPGCGNYGNYLTVFYGGSATPPGRAVVVRAGRATSGVDQVLPRAGEIEGTVTDDAGHLLAGTCATITQTVSVFFVSAEEPVVNGRYAFTGLPGGPYTVGFASCSPTADWAPQWWDKKTTAAKADVIHLSLGESLKGIDGVLVPGAGVSGRLVGPNGAGVAGICVEVGTPFEIQIGFATQTSTGSNGDWSAGGFTSGSYDLAYIPGCGSTGDWAAVPHGGKVTLETGHETALPPFKMPLGGEIQGTVTDSEGGGVANICVVTGPDLSGPLAVTSADGSYVVHNVPAGKTVVAFVPNCTYAAPENLLAQWWPDEGDPADAGHVIVTPGNATTGIDAALEAGGIVRGTLRGPAGSGLLLTADPGPVASGFYLLTVSSGPTGGSRLGRSASRTHSFEVIGVPTGTYELVALSGSNIPVTYTGGPSPTRTAPVTAVSVVAGGATDGISVTIPPSGRLAGTVTSSEPIKGPSVCLSMSSPSGLFGFTVNVPLSKKGAYRLSGVSSGTYELGVSACLGGDVAPASRRITVAPGSTKTTDFSLARGAEISGTAVAAGPKVQVCLELFPVTSKILTLFDIATAVAGAGGRWHVEGLAAGSYDVLAGPCSSTSPVAQVAAASPVRVGTGQSVSAPAFSLPIGGSLSGVVTSAGGKPVPGLCVDVYDPTTLTGRATLTGPNGGYKVRGLDTGKYIVEYAPGCGSDDLWAPQYSGGVTDPSKAQPEPVTNGQGTTAVDATMLRDGSVSGTVSAAGGGALSGICVVAANKGSRSIVPALTSSSAGLYTVVGLPAGTFAIGFASGCGGGTPYVTDWYRTGGTESQATPVTVTPGAATTGIDVTLHPPTP
jgi:hypothetical protein